MKRLTLSLCEELTDDQAEHILDTLNHIRPQELKAFLRSDNNRELSVLVEDSITLQNCLTIGYIVGGLQAGLMLQAITTDDKI